MTDFQMKWKVVIVGPTGTVYKDTNAFTLLYPFPTHAEAEGHAESLRTLGINPDESHSAIKLIHCNNQLAKLRG